MQKTCRKQEWIVRPSATDDHRKKQASEWEKKKEKKEKMKTTFSVSAGKEAREARV